MNKDVIYRPEEAILKASEQFETPFFLYSEEKLRENCGAFRDSFRKYFADFQPMYAVKANSNPAVLKVIAEEGFEFDSSSKAEVWITSKMGYKGMFTGNYTPASTLSFVKEHGYVLNLDDVSMVEFLPEIGIPEVLSFRINPGISKGGMKSLFTAGPDAKFGVPFEQAAEGYRRAKELGVQKFGIHMMTGSNVLEPEYFAGVVSKLLEIVADITKEAGVTIEFMNIGGGFGVPYRPEEVSIDLDAVAKGIRAVMDDKCAELGIEEPKLMAEPGRYIAADAGWLVGRVQVIKNGYKKFIGIDAASNDMPRPSIYDAYHYISVIPEREEKEVVSVVGTICENNDQFARDRELSRCEIGDLVVIHNCGAHAFSMGHNYNGMTRHAEYLLESSGEVRLIRKAETVEDLFKGCV